MKANKKRTFKELEGDIMGSDRIIKNYLSQSWVLEKWQGGTIVWKQVIKKWDWTLTESITTHNISGRVSFEQIRQNWRFLAKKKSISSCLQMPTT